MSPVSKHSLLQLSDVVSDVCHHQQQEIKWTWWALQSQGTVINYIPLHSYSFQTGWYNYFCRGNSKILLHINCQKLSVSFWITLLRKQFSKEGKCFCRQSLHLQDARPFCYLTIPWLYLPSKSILMPYVNRGDNSWFPVFLLVKLVEITFLEWLINQ